MAVVIDSGPLLPAINPRDPDHGFAREGMARVHSGVYGAGIVPDVVAMEVLTDLRVKVRKRKLSEAFCAFVRDVRPRPTDHTLLGDALQLHFKHWSRHLNLTDCVRLPTPGVSVARF